MPANGLAFTGAPRRHRSRGALPAAVVRSTTAAARRCNPSLASTNSPMRLLSPVTNLLRIANLRQIRYWCRVSLLGHGKIGVTWLTEATPTARLFIGHWVGVTDIALAAAAALPVTLFDPAAGALVTVLASRHDENNESDKFFHRPHAAAPTRNVSPPTR